MQLGAPSYVVLIVADLERSLRFYVELLGLRLGHRAGPYAQLDTGTTRVALYERSAMEETLALTLQPPSEDAPSFELGFKVSDVDAIFSELVDMGARPVMPPSDRGWGQRSAYLRDPDGYLIEVVQDLAG